MYIGPWVNKFVWQVISSKSRTEPFKIVEAFYKAILHMIFIYANDYCLPIKKGSKTSNLHER